MSVEERGRLYQIELIKAGVDSRQAEKAAKLLAENPLDEQLTHEEHQLIQSVCNQWLAQRKRMTFISQVLNNKS
jgi:uncharacterized protein YaiI (UPF0178 family)